MDRSANRPFRWVVVALLFLATLINYMDRQILGLLKPDLSKTFHWSEKDYAYIVVAFQAAYAIGQVLFGPIVRWLGTKLSYAGSILLWSFAAASHALAASPMQFGLARFALGLGESGNYPIAIQAVTEWFPPRQRSVATGIFNSGSNIGAILTPWIVPALTLDFGWRAAFVLLGSAGLVWLLFWLVVYREAPPAQIGEPKTAAAMPWIELLEFRQTWAYVATGILVGPVWWFYLFWLPDFFSKQFGLNLSTFGPPLIAVYAVTSFGSVAGGGLSAWLLRCGWSLNAARKTAALACAFCTVPVIFVPHLHSVWIATACFALAAAAHQGWSATMYTVVADLFPTGAVGSIVGLGGSCAAVASMLFAWFVGLTLQKTGDYSRILPICGSAYIAAFLIFHLMVPKLDPIAAHQ
ncbi:MAG: MFS transporter [Tepidisphaeraceae bacterium]|jgi:ACS family hexuronate transporter-like MFS transporter